MRVTVKAPARLHFGFIDLDGSLGRMFGSIGLAIDEPTVILEAAPAKRLSVDGDESHRVEPLARRFLRHYHLRDGVHISIKETIPPHVGLGSGTQIALSVATALARVFSIEASVRDLASVMGRGKRSGIGVTAFEQGGFIVDGGRRVRPIDSPPGTEPLPPPIVRHPFPEEWVFVVAIPRVRRGLAGSAEDRALRRLAVRSATGAARLSRIVLMQMLPALLEHDAAAFGRALAAIQRIVGAWFRPVQGGIFASSLGAEIAREMARSGAMGVGQSSWGPTVYGMAEDWTMAQVIEKRVREAISGRIEASIFVARGFNRGAEITVEN